MSAHPISALPLGPLDPERSELLMRVVDGLEPATLQWLSGLQPVWRTNVPAADGPLP